MPTSNPTVEDSRKLDRDIKAIEEKLQNVSTVVRGWYGKDGQAAIRADEVIGALERLKWVLERGQKARAAGK